ncbi:MAG TPA: hypothetical protein VI094_20765 [Propionibacteriaceae bacterium]
MQIRDDLGVPAPVFNSETEAPWLFPAGGWVAAYAAAWAFWATGL